MLRKPCQPVLRGFFYSVIAAFLIGSTAFDFTGRQDWHDQQRIGQGVLLILLLLAWRGLAGRTEPGTTGVEIPAYAAWGFFLFAAAGALSAALAQAPRWALLEWSLFLSLLLGVLWVAQIRTHTGQRFDRAVLGILAATCAIQLFSYLGAYAATLAGSALETREFFSRGFSNLRMFGQFQTMTLPLLALLVCYSRRGTQRIAAVGLLTAWWVLAFASGTRGTWLGMAVATILIGLPTWSAGRIWLRWHLAGAALGLVLYGVLFYAVPAWLGNVAIVDNRLPDLFGLTEREIIWTQAWDMIRQHPWLGLGPMHFAFTFNAVGAHPHNAILQIAAEWGVPAMLLLAGLATLGLIRFAAASYRQSFTARQPPLLQVALLACLIGAATQSLVDGVIVMPYSQTVLMLLAGWAMGIHFSAKASDQVAQTQPVSRLSINGMTLVAAGLLITLVATAYPELTRLQSRENAYLVDHSNYFYPRFWRQGWIAE